MTLTLLVLPECDSLQPLKVGQLIGRGRSPTELRAQTRAGYNNKFNNTNFLFVSGGKSWSKQLFLSIQFKLFHNQDLIFMFIFNFTIIVQFNFSVPTITNGSF